MENESLDIMSNSTVESANTGSSSSVSQNSDTNTGADSIGGDIIQPESSNNTAVNNGTDDTKAPTNGKKDYSDLEKAKYSFHKQFSRQKAKYDKQLAAIREEFERRLSQELDKRDHPEKYRPKTRKDFDYDDDYLDYLTEQRVNKILVERANNYKQEQERLATQRQEDESYKAMVTENLNKCYTTPEAIKDWKDKINIALDNGLGQLLDSDEYLSNYILTNPLGPKIMYELATRADVVKDIFALGSKPNGEIIPRNQTDRLRKLDALITRLAEANSTQPAVQQQTKRPLGKPGLSAPVKKDIWNDSKALLDLLYR